MESTLATRDLPGETMLGIFSHLPDEELLTTARVSSRWLVLTLLTAAERPHFPREKLQSWSRVAATKIAISRLTDDLTDTIANRVDAIIKQGLTGLSLPSANHLPDTTKWLTEQKAEHNAWMAAALANCVEKAEPATDSD